MHGSRVGGNGQDGALENSISYYEKYFYCEGGQILEQVAQRGGGIFILGHIQNSTGQSPEQAGIIGLDFEMD